MDNDIFDKESTDDPRQSSFKKVTDNIKNNDNFEVKKINDERCMFRAASVNLGQLQDSIMKLIEKKEIKSSKDIKEFIISSVERVKGVDVKYSKVFEKECRYAIELLTKDDFGYYSYGFNTRLISIGEVDDIT